MYLKRFILIAFVILSYSAFSQSLTLTYHSHKVKHDTTCSITCGASETITDSVTINNVSKNAIEVLVKKVIIDTLPGTTNLFCWGIHCDPSAVYLSPDSVLIYPGSSYSKFNPKYNPDGKVGTSTIRYVFFNKDNKKDSASITINFISTPAGVINIHNSSFSFTCYPNPVANQFNINYSTETVYSDASGCSLLIYNLSGQKVSEIILSNTKGKVTVNTSTFSEGIYMVNLINRGQIYPLRKFSVIH